MTTSRLSIYNGALEKIGKRRIASLTVNEEARHLMDTVWNDGGIQYCLEQGQWKFAMRTQMLDYDTALDPLFGYRRGFTKPTDWVATSSVCSDEYFNQPVLRYNDEVGILWCDLDRIYMRFVSNHVDYGNDLSRWPASFTEYVKTYFAGRICLKATGDKELALSFVKDKGLVSQALLTAQNRDAQNDPPKFPATGNWVNSRRGTNSQWRDGGNRNRLMG